MITIEIKLASANGPKYDEELGTMIIDNLGTGTRSRGNYRARMYPKGAMQRAGDDTRVLVSTEKHHREAFVNNHARVAEPVGNLVAKAFTALGYK